MAWDRQTLRDWVHRYNADGLSGLSNRRSPGRPPWPTPAQKAALAAPVEHGPDPERDGVMRWRRKDLKRRIEEMFGAVMQERTVAAQLAELAFVRLTLRPRHPKPGEAAPRGACKKISPPQWQKSPVASPRVK
ncbi:helix-turn-helix domain-containing protein [Sinorhizobium alkalisoli]|uniref:helix-turn-helix domain-containing protein n=1 Tax=Sinorhizobium alkalisoli TaxID=1752398 RepID=UPI0013F4DE72|nr:helix-turn-helix domain-containing protein [Sinorhizobium alkalisoli]